MATDVEHLKFVCEKLAYVCFLEDKEGQFKQQGITHEDIERFIIKVFVEERYNDDEGIDLRMFMRFTVLISLPDDKTREITFLYQHPVFMDAIVEQILEPSEDEPVVNYNFEFGRPNPIVLYDAEFLLEEELGVILNDLER